MKRFSEISRLIHLQNGQVLIAHLGRQKTLSNAGHELHRNIKGLPYSKKKKKKGFKLVNACFQLDAFPQVGTF